MLKVMFIVPRRNLGKDTIAVVTAKVVKPVDDIPDLSDPAVFKTVLKSVVTEWINSTPEGKSMWASSDGELNIGDLASALPNNELRVLLAGRGIFFMEIGVHKENCVWCFDHILANRDDIEN